MSFSSDNHGIGIFLADNYAGYDFLDKSMKADCGNINDDYNFFRFVMSNNGGYFSRDEFLCWFHSAWRFIPKDHLYETYKDCLDDMYLRQGHWAYSYFFKPDLRKAIMELNKLDTVENPTLKSLLDEDGYLPVYHGHYKKTMHNSYSWSLSKDNAVQIGRKYAYLYQSPTFYCVTGRVRLEDVIMLIEGHREHEVAVMHQRVKDQTKEFYNSKDFEVKFPL